jgi:septal ring factor EnvC (AmiA/AmiB activator)
MATLADKDKEIATLTEQLASQKRLTDDKVEALDAAHKSGALTEAARARFEKLLADEKDAHATTSAERDSLRDDVAEASQVITHLNAQLSKAQAGTGKSQPLTVEHGGKTYHVKVPKFTLMSGITYEAADVTTGSDVLAELVRIKSGVLEEVDA